MDPKAKALATIAQWNQGTNVPQASAWKQVAAPLYATRNKPRTGWAKWAPAIGATGAGLGVLAAPFTGGSSLALTIAALGAASAAGGAGGEYVAQRLNREKTNVGNILKEGAISGVTGAIPFGGFGKAARVAESAVSNAATTGAEQVAKNATRDIFGKQTTTSKILESARQSGQRLESRAGGYGQGVKLSDGSRLSYSQVQKIKANDLAEKIPAGHPDIQGKVIEQRLGEANSQLDNAINVANRRFVKGEVRNGIIDPFEKSIRTNTAIAGKPLALKRMNELSSQYANIKSVKQAVKAKRDIQNEINFGRNNNSVVPAVEQVNKKALKTLDDFINSKNVAPEIGNANKRVSQLIQRLDLSGAESSALKNQANNAGGGVVGRVTTGDAATSGKSRIGNFLQKSGNVPTNTLPGRIASVTSREFAKQGLASAIFGTQPPSISPEDQQAIDLTAAYNNGIFPEATGTDPNSADAASMSADTGGQQPAYSLEQALVDAQRDPKHADTYLSFAKAFESSAGKNKPTAAQQKQLMGNATATQLINQIEGNLSGLPSGRLAGYTAQLTGKAGFNDKVNAYEAQRPALALMLIKAIQGSAGQISDADRNAIQASIPSVHDTVGERKQKLTTLRGVVQAYQGAAQGDYGSTSNDLTSVLSQLQGGY